MFICEESPYIDRLAPKDNLESLIPYIFSLVLDVHAVDNISRGQCPDAFFL